MDGIPSRSPSLEDMWRQRAFRTLAFLTIAILVAIVIHRPLLRLVPFLVTVHDPLAPARLILPMASPAVAADLYRRGYGQWIATWESPLTRLQQLGLLPPGHEAQRAALLANGVPPTAIVNIGRGIRNDVELGCAVAAFLAAAGGTSVIVVAPAPASGLIRRRLRRGLRAAPVDLRIHPVAPRDFVPRFWWRASNGWITYFDTYVLWLVGGRGEHGFEDGSCAEIQS